MYFFILIKNKRTLEFFFFMYIYIYIYIYLFICGFTHLTSFDIYNWA
ncbi:MAG: hypothetical protein N7Q72_05120 [Spiroplasma sp. Tabriz.8]|nr:hypothetical protein [Spiroplasma sp. Tabriz.8]